MAATNRFEDLGARAHEPCRSRRLSWPEARAEWTKAHREECERFLGKALSFPNLVPTTDLAVRLAGRRDDPAYNEGRAVEDEGARGIEFEGNSEHSAFYGNRVRPAE